MKKQRKVGILSQKDTIFCDKIGWTRSQKVGIFCDKG